MPFKIVIPASAILDQAEGILLLDYPHTCSRCDKAPAEHFETHRLKLRAGLKHNPLPGRRYKMERNYQVKIRLCQRCYLQNYLQAPETLAGDDTPLGRLSRVQNFLRTLGGITAGLGLLLLTPFVPASETLVPLKVHWWLPAIAGVGLILLGLLSQVLAKNQLLRQLSDAGQFERELVRAETRTPLFADPSDRQQIALEVQMNNSEWARQCAAHYHFGFEEYKQ
jgi:hypothetical protein